MAFFIDEILFRPDFDYGRAFSTTLSNIDIYLSTTSMAVNGLSSTFSDNIGADETLVHSGALSISSAFTGSGPKDFDILITLSTPFLYDPSLGNLLLDVKNHGGGVTSPFDANFGDPAVQRLYSSIFSGDVNSTTGSLGDNYGLVTKFNVTPIPEPATMVIFGVGLIVLAGARYKLKK